MVYVRSDSGADIFTQATDSSAIIGTASSDAPLRVFYRHRDWVKVLVPGTADQAGWVQTSRLQSDSGLIRVIAATGTAPPSATASASTTTAPEPVVRIWLSSVKSRELAETSWRNVQAAYGDLLENLEPTVHQVDLGAGNGGIWYHLYAGPLASSTDAQTLCTKVKLRAPNSNCLVIIK